MQKYGKNPFLSLDHPTIHCFIRKPDQAAAKHKVPVAKLVVNVAQGAWVHGKIPLHRSSLSWNDFDQLDLEA